MDLEREVRSIAEGAETRIPPLRTIETRSRRLRRRAQVVGVLGIAMTATLVGIGLTRDWTGPQRATAPAAPPVAVDETASMASEPPCRESDECGAYVKQLPQAKEWLGGRLSAAGIEYIDGYRPDGGGGHVNRRWGFQIWILREDSRSAQAEAAHWDYEPLWTDHGVTVFGRSRPGSPVAYFYWRAGATDTFLELDWLGSKATSVDDLRPVFGRIVAAQEDQPYPHEQ